MQSECGLTLRWSRLAPAWHLAREAVVLIIGLAGQAPHRRSRLSSNVRPQHARYCPRLISHSPALKYAAARTFALSLPEATEQPHHNFNSFRVRGKIFITVPPEQEHIHVFLSEAHREQALAMYPEFIEKLLWGGKVVGLRVSLASAPVAAVKELVRQAWSAKAPKALLGKAP